jgi:DoxX-like family
VDLNVASAEEPLEPRPENLKFLAVSGFHESNGGIHMSAETESKGMIWTGRVISTIVVLFMLFDSITKVIKVPQVVEASAKFGIGANTLVGIGLTLLVSTIVYVIPRTSIFGAILVSNYLGGAVCANVLVHSPVFNSVFPIVFGVLTWLGVYLREPRLRALVPFKS